MRVSTDIEGTNVAQTIDNSSPNEVMIYSKDIYLQYPFKSSIFIGTGDEEYGAFAKDGSSYQYNIEIKHDIIKAPIRDIQV